MAILFDDASSQYLEYAGAVRSAHALSMACWFNSDDTTNNQSLISIGTNGGSARWALIAAGGIVSDPIRAQSMNSAGSAGNAASGSGYLANTWHHAGGVFSASNSRIAYIDGTAGSANTTSITVSGVDRTTIGAAWATTLGNYMSGVIAEAAVWNVALTSADMASLARGFCPWLVRPESIVAYWPLIGRTDPSISKHGGFGMTWNNAPVASPHPRIIWPKRQAFSPDYAVAATVYPELMTSLTPPHRQPIVAVPY